MSVGKKSSPSRREEAAEEVVETVEGGGNGRRDGAVVLNSNKEKSKVGSGGGGKKAASARCFSGLEISIGPGPLKDVDAGKLKDQIRRWARAVVAYARQLSFGSPRSSPRTPNGGPTTARSATFPSKSGLGGARGEPEPPPP